MKNRFVSLLLVCVLAFGLMPAASASWGTTLPVERYAYQEVTLTELPDVFQGEEVYFTLQEFPVPEGWKVYATQYQDGGYVPVVRNEQLYDANGYPTGYREVINWVDAEGNLFDFSDWETPPVTGGFNDNIFHEGMCVVYDYKDKENTYSFIDAQGNRVINNVGAYDRFYNGYCVGGLNTQGTRVFDKTGKVVLTVEDLGSWGAFMGHYSDGLLAYEGYLGSDYFVGWINLQGQPVITLYSGDASSYNRDEDLSFGTTTFSEGYAFVKDGRGGRSYPAFTMIDTKGNEILTIDPKAPIYASHIGEDATTDDHAPYKVVDGKFWVGYVNTTPGIPAYEQYYSVLTDMDGNELFVGIFGVGMYGQFEDGVLVCAENPGVLDIHGNVIVPSRAKVENNGTFAGWFSIGHGRLQDNKTLAKFEGANGAGDRYFILELHQGTYTGSGKVYNAATGQITDGGTTNPDPEPTVDQPSSWAAEQVNAAIDAGIVPESLQSQYTQTATRAEFCALATALYETATGTEITQRATFSDTSDVNVEKMAGLGVVGGVGDGKFNPNGELNREQAATILARLAEALGKPLPAGEPTFADNSSISSWAREAVGQMQASGVMSGTGNNNFSPLQPYTREQCMMTTLRLFEQVG